VRYPNEGGGLNKQLPCRKKETMCTTKIKLENPPNIKINIILKEKPMLAPEPVRRS
jgi:hypothetical protein